MQESSSYAVGIDIGTTTVRAVVARIDASSGTPRIIGVGAAKSSGMRKGVVVNLNGPAQAIDEALAEAERMGGYEVGSGAMSINGAHILSTRVDGMVAVSSPDHEIIPDDLARIEEVATVGKVPANREILDVAPHMYTLDGQSGIKDPLGMTGTRLEMEAHVVSALTPYLNSLQKAAEAAKVMPRAIVPAGIAAAKAVLRENQIENGVALVDIGGSTTNVAVYEEGDLQFAGVVPLGGMHITNDLAIGLKTDPEVAEKIKLEHASAVHRRDNSGISIKHDDEIFSFQTEEIDEIVEARLEEIFEAVQGELKKAGRAGKLPSGVVLTGGTAHLKGIDEYAKQALGLAVRIGKPGTYGSVSEEIESPEYATAVGLMLLDVQDVFMGGGRAKQSSPAKKATGVVSRLFIRFRA